MSKSKTKTEIQAELEEANKCLQAYRDAKTGGVISQLKRGFSSSLLAATVGALLGAFVPMSVWWLVHNDLKTDLYKPALVLVLGGLAFSAKTVYQWTREAFSCVYKAAGFTILIEGILTFSEAEWLSLTALAYLGLVNAAATASTLAAVDSKEK